LSDSSPLHFSPPLFSPCPSPMLKRSPQYGVIQPHLLSAFSFQNPPHTARSISPFFSLDLCFQRKFHQTSAKLLISLSAINVPSCASRWLCFDQFTLPCTDFTCRLMPLPSDFKYDPCLFFFLPEVPLSEPLFIVFASPLHGWRSVLFPAATSVVSRQAQTSLFS